MTLEDKVHAFRLRLFRRAEELGHRGTPKSSGCRASVACIIDTLGTRQLDERN